MQRQALALSEAERVSLALHRPWHHLLCFTENVARLFRGEVLARNILGSEGPSYIAPVSCSARLKPGGLSVQMPQRSRIETCRSKEPALHNHLVVSFAARSASE